MFSEDNTLTVSSKMHDNRTIPFFVIEIKNGKYIITGEAYMGIYLYKAPITWIS